MPGRLLILVWLGVGVGVSLCGHLTAAAGHGALTTANTERSSSGEDQKEEESTSTTPCVGQQVLERQIAMEGDLKDLKQAMLALSRNSASGPEEPSHDPLLELKNKLIVLETKLEVAELKMLASETKLEMAETKLKAVESMGANLEAAETKLETVEAKLKAAEPMEGKLEAMEAAVEDVKSELKNATSALQARESRVAFYVWHSIQPLTVAAKATLVMNHVATNVGNGYDSYTGVFTVPVSGLYDFQASFMAYIASTKLVYAAIFVDNKQVNVGISDSRHGYWDQPTIRAIVHVTSGQKVCVKNPSATTAFYYVSLGDQYTTFSGFLIKAD